MKTSFIISESRDKNYAKNLTMTRVLSRLFDFNSFIMRYIYINLIHCYIHIVWHSNSRIIEI